MVSFLEAELRERKEMFAQMEAKYRGRIEELSESVRTKEEEVSLS